MGNQLNMTAFPKPSKKKKERPVKKIYKENVDMAKKIAKIRDWYTCQRCGNKENIHWSHVINEAADHRLSTYEYNIKALCYNCHLNFWHKNPCEAHIWFEGKFPGRYEALNKLHIEYSKEGKISREYHLNENERLKKVLESLI